MSTRPNILLICADQWRADCLSILGHPVVHTPTLDALVAGGVSFNHAYSATPVCIPARAALMTGLAQEHHGRLGYQEGIPWEYPITLAGEFSRQGYQTQAIGKMHVYPRRLQLGFQKTLLHDGYSVASRREHPDIGEVDDYVTWLREQLHEPEADDFLHGLHCNSHVARPWPLAEHLHPTNWTASEGVRFLRRRDQTKPFLLYLSFHRPHPPYDPPAWAFEQALGLDGPRVKHGNWTEDFAEWDDSLGAETIRGSLRPDIFARARAGYFGHIIHIDQQINRIIYALKEQGVQDNTLICFTSDHGELLGDHLLFRKSLPYEPSARVPLILNGANIPAGVTGPGVVELRDVMPTLLDYAKLEIPESIDGSSLLPSFNDQLRIRPHLHGELTTHGQSIQWLVSEGEKYIWFSSSGREQFFDLASDPGEEIDLTRILSPDDPRLSKWRAKLVEKLHGRPEGFVSEGKLVPGRPAQLGLIEGLQAGRLQVGTGLTKSPTTRSS